MKKIKCQVLQHKTSKSKGFIQFLSVKVPTRLLMLIKNISRISVLFELYFLSRILCRLSPFSPSYAVLSVLYGGLERCIKKPPSGEKKYRGGSTIFLDGGNFYF